jgi:hypothetical protein
VLIRHVVSEQKPGRGKPGGRANLGQYADKSGGVELEGDALDGESPVEIEYPVAEYPSKIVSHNFAKKPVFEGTLNGIKGQYLILDTGGVNVRKYGGYHLELS